MKKLTILVGLAVVFFGATGQAAMQVTLTQDAYSYGDGGEFNATPAGWPINALASYSQKAIVGNGFETFCIQTYTYFYPGGTYSAALSGASVGTGQNSWGLSTGNGQVNEAVGLRAGAAWLYSQFAQGLLAGYDYNANNSGNGVFTSRSAAGGALQNMIWYLQGQTPDVVPTASNNPFFDLVQTHFGGTGNGLGSAFATALPGYDGVYVLNLSLMNNGSPGWPADTGGNVQNQLFYAVPEPTTMIACAVMALPIGVSVLRLLRRKMA
jgi:hypothetical protein